MKRAVIFVTIALLLAIAIFSFGKIACYHIESMENQNNIKELVQGNDTKTEKYKRLKKQNPELIGWIKIPGTPVSYPVMYSSYDPEKYLDTDFEGNYSMSGLPFAAAESSIPALPGVSRYSNTLIYGHHMQDGSMFGTLTEYENQKFYEQHKMIIYDRIYDDGSYEEQEYEVISAFKTEIGNGFEYYRYANIGSKEEFREYLSMVRMFDVPGSENNLNKVDELLTLSTCSYHVRGKGGRFVVVAGKG